MAFTSYTGLTGPNEILLSIRTYVNALGLTISEDMYDDLDIFDRNYNDGKRLVFKDTSGTYFISLRTANGYQIFPDMAGGNVNYATSTLPTSTDTKFSGIGMIVSEGYSKTNRWFDQYRVPVKYGTTIQTGVAIKVAEGTDTFTLYCNHVTTPSETFMFTIVQDSTGICQHLICGVTNKLKTWTGGQFFSGSFNSYTLSALAYTTANVLAGIIPVLSTSELGSNTFLRINIDEAPTRGNIYWASSGKNITSDNKQCYTGKQLAMPIRYGEGITGTWRPLIVNYANLQSISTNNAGVNNNTLNCITINLPIFLAVKVDPDSLNNFAPVGTISGVFLVSLKSMASASTYEISYPASGVTNQVFSMSKRRGTWGFDGVSVTQ
jgi:hypothetical protein